MNDNYWKKMGPLFINNNACTTQKSKDFILKYEKAANFQNLSIYIIFTYTQSYLQKLTLVDSFTFLII